MRIRAVGRADVDADRRPLLVDGSVVAAFLFTELLKFHQTSLFVIVLFLVLCLFVSVLNLAASVQNILT